MTEELFQLLVSELERPRTLPSQAGRYLSSTYGIGRDEIPAFLVKELPKLEDYEIDLILSPVFTPSLEDQAVVAEFLGPTTVSPADIGPLIECLVARPLVARLRSDDGEAQSVTLREVSVDRYIRRLRLEGAIAGRLWNLIGAAPDVDQPMLKAVARRGIWELPDRRAVLENFLERSGKDDRFLRADTVALLRVMETYEPADQKELLSRIPQWMDVLRHELNVAGAPKPFFNERVEELHGGGRDRRRGDDAAVRLKQEELAFLERLQVALGGSGRE